VTSSCAEFLVLPRALNSSKMMVSLGPDCGVRTRIDEQALSWNKRGPTNFFDWTLSSLAVVAAVLECTDPNAFFHPELWSLVCVWPSGSYEFLHGPTGLRSLHDARVSEYESTDTARSVVAARYMRRLHRLRELLNAPGSLRFVHVVDNANAMNVHPPPSRSVVRRVRALLAERHHMVIVHDGSFVSHMSLSVSGVALVDTRPFQLERSELAREQGDLPAACHEPTDWKRAHLNWESLLLAVSVAVAPVDSVKLEVAITADGVGPCVRVAISYCGCDPPTAAVEAPAAVSSTVASMRCVFEALPDDGDVRIEDLFLAAEKTSLPGVRWCGWRTEPLFFGLEKLILIVRLCDEPGGSADDVLSCLQHLDGLQSARLLSAAQGADVFETCARLFSVLPESVRDLDLPCLTTDAAAQLIARGWATVDDWMPADVVERIASVTAASISTRSSGCSDGVMWRTPEPRHARTDVATWLTAGRRPADDPLLAAHLLPRFEALAVDLCALMAGVNGRLEVQLACFPADVQARYRRHTDANADGRPTSAERKVTCILYCNPEWCPASAGCLRLTRADHDRGNAAGTVDIEPIGGRLLVFMSGAIPHEVLATQADRFAVTAWLA
jgi:SM-20-related protein